MKLSVDFTRLQRGEEGKKILISVSEKYRGKNVRLCFLTPMGKTYFTDIIPLTDGEGEFTITKGLADGRGVLMCQLLLGEFTGDFLLKSPVLRLHVFDSVDDSDAVSPDGELKARALFLGKGENRNADYTGLQLSVLG